MGTDNTMDYHSWNFGFNITNITDIDNGEDNQIFTRKDVRIFLILSYTFVFSCCFFGNLLVIVVVTMHRRMKAVTNFFLTNLAFADMCVGLFCVYQNLSLYLANNWIFGDFLCKMYHFVHTLSYTASISILTIICVERYLAIIHPIWSKQVLTLRKLKIVVVIAWVISGAYCTPRLFMYGTITVPLMTGKLEIICRMKRTLYNSKIYDTVNFVVCFLLPLLIITILYFIICMRLWTSKVMTASKVRKANTEENVNTQRCSAAENIELPSLSDNSTTKSSSSSSSRILKSKQISNVDSAEYVNKSILRVRRKVIKLLVIVVLAFAVCHLPFHARKLWQSWSRSYNGTTYHSVILTITTTLILYLNSGINPFLYAYLSENFRKSMVDVLLCRLRRPHPIRKLKRTKSRSFETPTKEDTITIQK